MSSRFIANDWLHLARKVASLESTVRFLIFYSILLAGQSLLIGLMIYAVVKSC